jgi:outer membrane cobalamin receptor
MPVQDSITGGVSGLRSDFWRLPSEKLNPQVIRTFEAGFSYIIQSNLILTLNGFLNDMDDILSSEGFTGQSFKGIPVNIIERPVNQGNATSYGGTARMNFKKSWSSLTLNAMLAYTFTDGKIGDKQVPFTARNTVKSVFDINYKRISASARFLYRSKSYHRSLRDADGNIMFSDPYGIVNLTGKYAWLDKNSVRSEIFIKVSNLLNSKYYNVPVGGQESIRMAPQDPLRFLLGVNLTI